MRTLDAATCCLSAHEVVARLRDEGAPVGVASAYRILERLDELGLVHRIDIGDGIARYEPIQPGLRAHHHLVCIECGLIVPFEDERIERALSAARPPSQFIDLERRLVLRGRCVRCGRADRARSA